MVIERYGQTSVKFVHIHGVVLILPWDILLIYGPCKKVYNGTAKTRKSQKLQSLFLNTSPSPQKKVMNVLSGAHEGTLYVAMGLVGYHSSFTMLFFAESI